ncbi:hypothetical protein B0J14DRAFT_350339 [Halenospora varia]|nr:hypothetical protein B0J14DRAFT_350339 [Halenospora varia]
MVTKIKARSSTDDKLVEECQNKTNCGDCDPIIAWTTPSKGIRTTPPQDMLVIIVNVRSNRGAIYIYKTESGEYVDSIGTEQAGNRVMVP